MPANREARPDAKYDGPMTPDELLGARLANQLLTVAGADDAATVVSRFLAVQAQEYNQSVWALGLRTPQADLAAIEAAVNAGTILRTWPMRGTIHFVPAADARWLVDLLAPRKIRQMTSVYEKIGLTTSVLSRAGDIVAAMLTGGHRRQRKDLYSILTQHGIDCSASPNGSRGGHILGYLSMLGLICLGPLDGRQATFVLLDEWAPASRVPAEPLAELARRYFASHGPATEKDFAWWSGLTLREVRQATELAGPALASVQLAEQDYWFKAESGPRAGRSGAWLLPAFDEYTVAYRDRTVLLGGREMSHSELLNPVMVLDGLVVGVWRATTGKTSVRITLAPFDGVRPADLGRFEQPCAAYGAFAGLDVEVESGDYRQVRRIRAQ
jgi:Winged helix DNA-binding domain